MNKNFTTCKLIFTHGITKEGVEELLRKYTALGTVATFEPDITVGCNRMAFAVVDIPQEVAHQLVNDKVVLDIDMMSSYGKKLSMAESCGSGGCGCGS